MKTVRYDAETEIEVPITSLEPENAVSAGVSYRVISPGVVPPFEEQEARLERGFTLEQWTGLPVFERALVIASRRVRIAQGNLQADAEIREAKRRGKTGRKK